MLGVLINVITVIIGSSVGLLFKKGMITGKDDVLADEISAEAYAALQGLFDKP